MIVKVKDGKWELRFSDGRKETFDSEKKAKDREMQINYFKHIKKGK